MFDFDQFPSTLVVPNRRSRPYGDVKKFLEGPEPFHALQHGKFLNGNMFLPCVTLVPILRRFKFFGLVPEDMEVRVKFLEILQAEPNSSLHTNIQGHNQGAV